MVENCVCTVDFVSVFFSVLFHVLVIILHHFLFSVLQLNVFVIIYTGVILCLPQRIQFFAGALN